MKKALLFLIILITIQVAYAQICEDRLDNGSWCLMMTPAISCNQYDIIVDNGTIVQDDQALTLLNNSVYYFNFTEETGNYLVQLCDNSTREFRVIESYDTKFKNEEDARMYIAIVIIIGVLIAAFMYLAIKVKDFSKEKLLNSSLMMLFFFMALGLSIVGLQIAKEMAVGGALSSDISALITASYKIALWTLYVMIAIVFIIGIYNIFMYAKDTSGLSRKRPNLYDRGTRNDNDRGSR